MNKKYMKEMIAIIKEGGCPNCGGTLLGDGFTVVLHCENAELPMDVEPDSDVVLCDN
jgi:uncharacterized protein (DUF983 family)